MPIRRTYGAHRDHPDARDFKLSHLPLSVDHPLPSATTLRRWVWNIKDQAGEGSCTGHRTAESLEWHRHRFLGDKTLLSPQFPYDIERQLEGTPLTEDSGADPRDGCKCLTTYGICPEALMPYGPANYSTPPTTAQLTAALKYRGGAYHRVENLIDLKHCLADLPGFPGHVCGFAFNVPEEFESAQVERNGLVPYNANSVIVGRHDTLAVDFDDSVRCPGAAAGAALCQNSWGEWGTDAGTGLRGFFWFPYDAIEQLVSDMWVHHLGAPWRPKSGSAPVAAA